MLLLTVLLSCKAVDPAPEGLDDVLHYLWQQVDDGSDAQLADALVNLDVAVDGGGLEEAFDGSVSRLSTEEAALVGVVDRDPAQAAGVFLVNTFPCDPAQLERILSYARQDELYEGVYESYDRVFDNDREAWLSGADTALTYQVDYTAKLLGSEYAASARGSLRRVPDAEGATWGDWILQRVWLPTPAVFDNDNRSMDQDYQLELYWPRGDGRIVHAYGMWRQASYGAGIDMESDATQRILLNNLLDWDDNTEQLCASEGLAR
ncbi:MAG: hypothetical protein KTR31_41780 [Myxococcales bacterium]|nr:hypothetical protein [Myxococcales bacterium]